MQREDYSCHQTTTMLWKTICQSQQYYLESTRVHISQLPLLHYFFTYEVTLSPSSWLHFYKQGKVKTSSVFLCLTFCALYFIFKEVLKNSWHNQKQLVRFLKRVGSRSIQYHFSIYMIMMNIKWGIGFLLVLNNKLILPAMNYNM